MKNWLAAGAVAVAGIQTASAIELTDELTLWGYFDMAYVYTDIDNADSEQDFGVAAYYASFQYDFGDGVTARADLGGGSDEDFDIVQANATYSWDNGAAVTAGKWLSSTGWESFYAPYLYQFSYSSTLVYPAMMNGVNVTYTAEKFRLLAAALTSAWDSTETDASNPAFEASAKLFPIENLTLFAGVVYEDYEAVAADPDTGLGGEASREQNMVNLWASYVLGDLTLAAELNLVYDFFGVDQDGIGWLAMANYAFTDKASVTLRGSGLDVDATGGGKSADVTSVTLAGLYSFTDNLAGVLEAKTISDDVNGDSNEGAVELVLSF